MIRNLILLTTVAGVAACGDVSALDTAGDAADSPPEARGLELSVEAQPRQVAAGRATRLVAVLTNRRQDSVRLEFDDSCQMLIYVEDAGGEIVVPDGGRWMCLDVRTSLTLAPGERVRHVLPWTGRRHLYDRDSRRLPGGEYVAYATIDGRLDDRALSLRSEGVALTLNEDD